VPFGSAVNVLGVLTVNGTLYRRKTITATNLTGLATYNAAQVAYFTSANTAASAITKVGSAYTAAGKRMPLMPSSNGQVFPFALETDDTVILSPNPVAGDIDFSVVQTWIPIIP
ncbi:MAG TPA: hypothetical protein VHC44_14260, partial [Verrucomicrobiae bacterium]|nr:hypothetical protein [Verrucomicrobiae bacterium]